MTYYGIDFSFTPQCTRFGRFKQKKGWNHAGWKYESYLLVFIIGGAATFYFLNSEYKVESGDWLLIPKGEYYEANAPEFCEYYYFHFDSICEVLEQKPEIEYSLCPNYSTTPNTIISKVVYLTERMTSGDNLAELMRISSQMQRLILQISLGERLLFDQYFGQVILLLSLQVFQSTLDHVPPLLMRAIGYIQDNYTRSVTLAELADELSVSKSYLLRVFKRNMGMTVTDYINGVKLDYAAQLLRTSSMNVSQIAEYFGYLDSSYFSRLFRKRFGISPSEFARK